MHMPRHATLLLALGLLVPLGPACAPTGTDTDAGIVRFLSDRLPGLAAEHDFSGVVLFAHGDTVLFHRAYGLASRRDSTRNQVTTRFNLASASKMFTAVAVARLVEEGRLSYDDPIGRYLGDDWVSPEVGRKVLVRHLLSHTSGLGMYWDAWDRYASRIRTIDDYRQVVSDSLAFEPGARFQYSNTGFILLGAIIEKVTGRPYYDVVRESVFVPCGMESTGFFEHDRPRDGFAIGYFRDKEDGGRLKDNLGLHGIIGASAGGGWSTAADLHRFLLALRDDRLLKGDTRVLLWSPKPPATKYGYGFQIGDGWVGHTGGFPGIEAFIYYFPASDHTWIVLSNFYDSALPLMKEMRPWFKRLRERR